MPPVSLAKLVSALQLLASGEKVRISGQTGEVIADETVGSDSAGAVEGDRTISINLDEIELARRFAETVSDPEDRRRLELALLNAQAVEAFEQAVYRVQKAHRWFPFRELELGRHAKAALEAQGIPFVDDLQ